MRFSQRKGLLGGLALLACAMVLLQAVLTRLYAAILGPHTALVAHSLPLAGIALGGVLLYIAPGLVRPARLFAGLGYFACAVSASTAIAMIVLVQPRWVEAITMPSIGRLGVLYFASLLPFLFAGVAIAGAVRGAFVDIGRVYCAHLVGAALGGVSAVFAFQAGGPRAGLIASVIAGAAAVFFYAGGHAATSSSVSVDRRPSGGVVATFALGTAVLLAGDVGAPWLKVPALRWMRMDKVELQRWTPSAVITVERPVAGIAWMQSDGATSMPILEAKKMPDPHPADLAYALHKGSGQDGGPILVLGAAGGIDVRRALKAGKTEIHATEASPVIVEEVMRGKYRELSGDLYGRPEVRVTNADGRSFVRGSRDTFRSIVLALPDTWQATATGALSLASSRLYTVEAFRDYIEHLTPDGTLLVSRWDTEVDRLLALASAGLWSAGSDSPKDHLFACNHDRTTTLLVKRAPLTKEDLTLLRALCRRHRFQEVFAPDVRSSDLRGRITTMPNARAAAPGHPTDVTAPTDDRPFFSYAVPAYMLPKALRAPLELSRENQGLFVLALVLATGVVLKLLLLLVPIAARPAGVLGAPDRGTRLRSLLFFLALGAGFVLGPITLVEHATTLLGHPALGLPIAASVFLLAAALGSYRAGRVDPTSAALVAGRRAQLATALLAVYAVGATVASAPMLRSVVLLPFAGRLVVALALLAPLGFLFGSLLPLGVKLVGARAPELLPWCWGLGGAAGLGAIGLGTMLAMHLGYSSILIAGGLVYLMAAVLVPPAVAGGAMAPGLPGGQTADAP